MVLFFQISCPRTADPHHPSPLLPSLHHPSGEKREPPPCAKRSVKLSSSPSLPGQGGRRAGREGLGSEGLRLRTARPHVGVGVVGAVERRGEHGGAGRSGEPIVAQLRDAGRVLREGGPHLLGQGGAIEGVLPGADDFALAHGVPPAQIVVGQHGFQPWAVVSLVQWAVVGGGLVPPAVASCSSLSSAMPAGCCGRAAWASSDRLARYRGSFQARMTSFLFMAGLLLRPSSSGSRWGSPCSCGWWSLGGGGGGGGKRGGW